MILTDTSRFDSIDRHFQIVDNRLANIQQSVLAQGRTFMFGLIGSSASMASLCLGAIALLR